MIKENAIEAKGRIEKYDYLGIYAGLLNDLFSYS